MHLDVVSKQQREGSRNVIYIKMFGGFSCQAPRVSTTIKLQRVKFQVRAITIQGAHYTIYKTESDQFVREGGGEIEASVSHNTLMPLGNVVSSHLAN